jgi:hypothetical protein
MALKTNFVAPAGGILILIGGLALAYYTGTHGTALVEARAKAVQKYVSMTEKALAKGDMKMAEKYAKEALVVDPKNKQAIAEFKKVVLASCPKAAPTPAATPTTPASQSEMAPAGASQPAAATAPADEQPAKPQAEAEEEMGCI